MNNSGKAVRYWALKEKIPLQNILIITDDLHLPFGDLRLRHKGSPAGHNGLKDVENQLNTSNYPRLRFGIGQNYKTFDQVKFVLDQWDETEKTKIEKRVSICTEAIVCFCLEGINNAMNKRERAILFFGTGDGSFFILFIFFFFLLINLPLECRKT